ncbi:MAG: BrnT family toxin [Termitinemataceae bacterium]|nr:MAG: BrnT family toxin [Termitinemataceae bacterium]
MQLESIEWDEEKNEKNKRDHKGLSFEIAQYVFSDPERIERRDFSENNNSTEDRYQTLGKVGKVLFVVYTERGINKHIISARVAEKYERKSYNGYYHIDGKGWTKAA